MSLHFPVNTTAQYSILHSNVNIRLLDSLERQLAMNLLWLDSAIAQTTLGVWIYQEKKKYGPHAQFDLHLIMESGCMTMHWTCYHDFIS